MGTRLITSSTACDGGGEEARVGTRSIAIESGGAGSRRGAGESGWVGTKLPGAVWPPG